MVKQDPAIHDQLPYSQRKNMQKESATVKGGWGEREERKKSVDLMLPAELDTKTCWKIAAIFSVFYIPIVQQSIFAFSKLSNTYKIIIHSSLKTSFCHYLQHPKQIQRLHFL